MSKKNILSITGAFVGCAALGLAKGVLLGRVSSKVRELYWSDRNPLLPKNKVAQLSLAVAVGGVTGYTVHVVFDRVSDKLIEIATRGVRQRREDEAARKRLFDAQCDRLQVVLDAYDLADGALSRWLDRIGDTAPSGDYYARVINTIETILRRIDNVTAVGDARVTEIADILSDYGL